MLCVRVEMALVLSTSLAQPLRPAVVLVHGLDSAQDTWSGICSAFALEGQPCLAIDLRGHGTSELGDGNFSSAAIVADIFATVRAQGVTPPFFLVGHSMGGRVAMSYAAAHPSDIAALVIEDMDLRPRDEPEETADLASRLRCFDRVFATWSDCKEALVSFGYEPGRIDRWRGTRIWRRADGKWWSNINPFAAFLARKHVLASADGRVAFAKVARDSTFPVHLLVAGIDSSCEDDGDDGVQGMQAAMPRLQVSRFERAGHSIHNTAKDEFLRYLRSSVFGDTHPSKLNSVSATRPFHRMVERICSAEQYEMKYECMSCMSTCMK